MTLRVPLPFSHLISTRTSTTLAQMQSPPSATLDALDAEQPSSLLDSDGVNTSTSRDANHLQNRPCAVEKPQEKAGLPPDGGFVAWFHVACSFALFFNSWGILSTFGVFQTHYESGDIFTASSSDISWIGAVQYCMAMMTGFWAGPAYDRGYLRLLVVLGGCGVVLGHTALSFCKTYAQVLLAEGFCVGIGAGCLFVCAVSILPGYFTSRLGLAMGIASSGSAIGAVVYSVVASKLLKHLGFAWMVRILGFIALGILAVPVVAMRMRRAPSSRSRGFIDRSAFTDVSYLLFVVGTFFASSTLSTINSYISFFTESNRLASHDMSFYIVAILNAASFFGRIIPNFASDHLGPLNVIFPCSLVTGLVSLCTIAVNSLAGAIMVAVWLGFFSGVFIAMPPVCFASLTQDKSAIGTRIGMGYSLAGLGYLAGAPAAGKVLNSAGALDWHSLWLYCGLMSIAASLTYLAVRVSKMGFRVLVKG
ncbi:Major Facilitator Superfamily protein [Metarhizium rileyi]|uniref:Major Facilitator Superfamily protein n=1 Tax=Metarhizium rileyi (strain RCEF 4871) TaxID=1649241 RepID=A0A167EBV9_METRR|nr:Major Facilitator Superfamily protein [Metarhizium rileyi RCEF 4871]